MFTAWLRRTFKPVLEFVASIFLKLHITPNTITVIGLLISVLVAYLIITDRLLWSGVVYFIGASMDAIDGTLARQMNVRSKFGAFLDSTLDRLGESIVIASIAVWAAQQENMLGVLIAFAALVFSFLVSYTRARAESLGYECKVGIGTRVERFFITVISLLFQVPILGMAVIMVAAGITVVQRIYVVWKQATAEATAQQ